MNEERLEKMVAENFAEHELEVLHDDGLYRHWRCSKPSTWTYGFDVTTWPGHLCVTGDIGCWTFSRTRDMLDFFEGSGHVDLHYWSEKLQDGHERARNKKALEQPQVNEEFGFEMPAGTLVDDGWNPQFFYACHGIVLAIRLYRERRRNA